MDLLSRSVRFASELTSHQKLVDEMVGGFVRQATDLKSIASVTVGGLAYRLGRMGVMGLGAGGAFRTFSLGAGLAAEVSAFEFANRALHSLHPKNLWRWSGNNGLKTGLLSSLITFGTLKGAGRFAQDQNLILQHLIQDAGMVLSHQASAVLQILPKPKGTLTEQFLHAEATNLQIGVGLALSSRLTPMIHPLERGLDLALRFPFTNLRSQKAGEEGLAQDLGLAFAGSGPLKSPGNLGFKGFILQARIVDKLKEWIFGEAEAVGSPIRDPLGRREGPYRDPANGSLISILEGLRERFPHPEAVEAYTRLALQKKNENAFYVDEVERGLAQIRDLMHHADLKIHEACAQAYPQIVKKVRLSKEAIYQEAALLREGFLGSSEWRKAFIESYFFLAKRFDKKDEAFWKEAGEVNSLTHQALVAQMRRLPSERDKELLHQLRGVEWAILKKMDWKDRGRHRYLTGNSFSEFVYDLFR